MTKSLSVKLWSLWRFGNGIAFGCTGIYLLWLFLSNYVPSLLSGSDYFGIPIDITLLPAVFLLLIAVGILLNKRWSLIAAGVTLLVFIVIFTFIMLGLIAFRNGLVGNMGTYPLSDLLYLTVPALYMLITACMALWYAKVSKK